jgi:hypothetical protein
MGRQRQLHSFVPIKQHAQTPLQKAIRRSLIHPASGWPGLRKTALKQIARWRLEGLADDEILARLRTFAADIARATGHDRVDLVTGRPRSARVTDAIERIGTSAGLFTAGADVTLLTTSALSMSGNDCTAPQRSH